MENKKAIGILGGMGPEASYYLYKTLIDLSIKYFGAKNNDDFPEIILHSIPVPDFISNDSDKKIALKILKDRIAQLNNANIICLAIACNTAHILLDELKLVSEIPFLSMIDEVVKQVDGDRINKVGLLTTPSTIRYSLYQKALEGKKMSAIVPNKKEQDLLEKIIRNVLRGKKTNEDQNRLLLISNSLKRKGAEGIILGCTELPLLFPEKYVLPVYNSIKILSVALLQKYYKQNTI